MVFLFRGVRQVLTFSPSEFTLYFGRIRNWQLFASVDSKWTLRYRDGNDVAQYLESINKKTPKSKWSTVWSRTYHQFGFIS